MPMLDEKKTYNNVYFTFSVGVIQDDRKCDLMAQKIVVKKIGLSPYRLKLFWMRGY